MVASSYDAADKRYVYNVGQSMAYDPPINYACRYFQQNLSSNSSTRGVDLCDHRIGMHYGIVSDPTGSQCTVNTPISNGGIPHLEWPISFIEKATFVGIDRINDILCNHFHSDDIIIDGKLYLFDIWTSVEQEFPCKIYAWEKATTIHTSWAFNGFTDKITSFPEECTTPQLICTKNDWICIAKPGIPNDFLGIQLRWVCDPNRLDCSPINPNGPHYLPNTVQNHCNWAFNAYYLKNRGIYGLAACDFDETAELVPPQAQTMDSSFLYGSIIENINLVC
jgi:hypothetical protein